MAPCCSIYTEFKEGAHKRGSGYTLRSRWRRLCEWMYWTPCRICLNSCLLMPASTSVATHTCNYMVSQNKKSPTNANGNVQQQCMFESPVKQNQLPEGARRPAANYL